MDIFKVDVEEVTDPKTLAQHGLVIEGAAAVQIFGDTRDAVQLELDRRMNDPAVNVAHFSTPHRAMVNGKYRWRSAGLVVRGAA